jgi:hypothetical protein
LQDALDRAVFGDTIRVAGGIYYPDDDRDTNLPVFVGPNHADNATAESFTLKSGVIIEGGYAGLANPTNPNLRDPSTYVTILSGDITQDNVHDSSNSRSVVQGGTADENAILDGVTVQHGYGGSGTGNSRCGAGIFCPPFGSRPSLSNLVVRDNMCVAGGDPDFVRGGGLYVGGTGGQEMSVEDCKFLNNKAQYGGGACADGMAAEVRFDRCAFTTNVAEHAGGGLAAINDAETNLFDSTFDENLVDSTTPGLAQFGGGMYTRRSTSELRHCRFTANRVIGGSNGGGLAAISTSTATVILCTFEANSLETDGGAGGGASVGFGAILDCTFSGNFIRDAGSALGGAGGGLDCADVAVANCLFYDNAARYGGGASRVSRNVQKVKTPKRQKVKTLRGRIHGAGVAREPRRCWACEGPPGARCCSRFLGRPFHMKLDQCSAKNEDLRRNGERGGGQAAFGFTRGPLSRRAGIAALIWGRRLWRERKLYGMCEGARSLVRLGRSSTGGVRMVAALGGTVSVDGLAAVGQ